MFATDDLRRRSARGISRRDCDLSVLGTLSCVTSQCSIRVRDVNVRLIQRTQAFFGGGGTLYPNSALCAQSVTVLF